MIYKELEIEQQAREVFDLQEQALYQEALIQLTI